MEGAAPSPGAGRGSGGGAAGRRRGGQPAGPLPGARGSCRRPGPPARALLALRLLAGALLLAVEAQSVGCAAQGIYVPRRARGGPARPSSPPRPN